MKKLVLVLALMMASPTYADCVVLLHGLARSEWGMGVIEKRLNKAGYETVNLGYPSREYPIAELAEKAIKPAVESCTEGANIHFVTHSLGGILVRQYLSQSNVPNLGRVVMLGPPNQGSEVIDKLKEVPGFHFAVGDAGLQLGTGQLSIPSALGPANFDLGIIAGNRSVNLILSQMIPEADDGKVSVASTKLEGMNDHLEMAVTHPFMVRNQRVIDQIIYYLKYGRFFRPPLS